MVILGPGLLPHVALAPLAGGFRGPHAMGQREQQWCEASGGTSPGSHTLVRTSLRWQQLPRPFPWLMSSLS